MQAEETSTPKSQKSSTSAPLPEKIRNLSPEQKYRLAWRLKARENQLPPKGDWRVWMLIAGRGFGKTTTAAEETAYRAINNPGHRIAVVAPIYPDGRDICIEGEHGLLHCIPPSLIRDYNRSIGEVTLQNESKIKIYSAEKPQRLRGPQHNFIWCEELAQWRYLDHPKENPWDNLMLGLRLPPAQLVISTTPKPKPKLKQIMAAAGTVVTRGSTYDNLANLAPAFRDFVLQYEGTSMAEQELHGALLDEMPGALWTRALIEKHRVKSMPPLRNIVIGVDPSTTDGEGADEAGLIAAGVGENNHCYIFEDCSAVIKPHLWGTIARSMFDRHGASAIIAESNQGGQMVRDTINFGGRKYPVYLVHAKAGKKARAEPVQIRYEQGLVHHVGSLPLLENQMCSWNPADNDASPDRLDAMVYAVTHLIVKRFDGTALSAPAVGTKREWAY